MKVMIDVCVALDVLMKRAPWYEDSARVCGLVADGHIEGAFPLHGVTTVWYCARKAGAITGQGEMIANASVDWIMDTFEIAEVTKSDVVKARNYGLRDFEDALVAAISEKACCEYIVTRNVKDYEGSSVKALTPGDFLRQSGFCD